MGSGATIIELLDENPINWTVADATGIEKGDLMVQSGSRTAIKNSQAGGAQPFAGIAAAEKVALDGSTTLALHKRGIFDMTLSGSTCSEGDLLVISQLGDNTLKAAGALTEVLSGCIVGKALEDGSDPETIPVLLGGI